MASCFVVVVWHGAAPLRDEDANEEELNEALRFLRVLLKLANPPALLYCLLRLLNSPTPYYCFVVLKLPLPLLESRWPSDCISRLLPSEAAARSFKAGEMVSIEPDSLLRSIMGCMNSIFASELVRSLRSRSIKAFMLMRCCSFIFIIAIYSSSEAYCTQMFLS